jgi:S-adenosylmethionine:tRNA ribosyltransferase-isomerase
MSFEIPILTSSFDFELDSNLIAQNPLAQRDQSRLLVCDLGKTGMALEEKKFFEMADFLSDDDFLVFNDAKVLPVRLLGHRQNTDKSLGGEVEALLTRATENPMQWFALLHLSAKPKPGVQFYFEPGLVAEVVSTLEEKNNNEGQVRLLFTGTENLENWLQKHGHIPLPPYIQRIDSLADRNTYQTVYAKQSGSAAAPTAGFHFTGAVLEKLKTKGVQFGFITLHVGIGTFRPMKSETLDQHTMHEEYYEISQEFLNLFSEAVKTRKRIVAVGTTAVRALESWVRLFEFNRGDTTEKLKPGCYKTSLFLTPGKPLIIVDDLITNFHLPRSTLIVLVAAAMGYENMKKAYAFAIEKKFRFFSYGDAMFIRRSKENVT